MISVTSKGYYRYLWFTCHYFFSLLSGARADDSQRECVNEQIVVDCPELQSVIQSQYYKELFWKVSNTSDGRTKQNIGYCNESLVCTHDDIGSFDERIKIRNPVRGTLFVKQLILDDQLTYTCHIERKENKAAIVNKVNVSSSKRCKYSYDVKKSQEG